MTLKKPTCRCCDCGHDSVKGPDKEDRDLKGTTGHPDYDDVKGTKIELLDSRSLIIVEKETNAFTWTDGGIHGIHSFQSINGIHSFQIINGTHSFQGTQGAQGSIDVKPTRCPFPWLKVEEIDTDGSVGYDKNTQTITITPGKGKTMATLFLPSNFTLDDLTIKTSSLDVHVEEVPLSILPKKVIINTGSGDVVVKGNTPSLEIRTGSGDVTLDDAGESGRSVLTFPPRDYDIDVSTGSGNINGTVAVTTFGKFNTGTGDLHVDLIPVFGAETSTVTQQNNKYFISTNTGTGDTEVSVLEPFWRSPVPVRGTNSKRVKSYHKSGTGKLRITYYSSWEGNLKASTGTGHQDITLNGVEQVFRRRNPFMGKIGSGNWELDIRTGTGDQNITLGS